MDAGWVSMFYEAGALLGVPGVAILSDKLLNGRKMLAMYGKRRPRFVPFECGCQPCTNPVGRWDWPYLVLGLRGAVWCLQSDAVAASAFCAAPLTPWDMQCFVPIPGLMVGAHNPIPRPTHCHHIRRQYALAISGGALLAFYVTAGMGLFLNCVFLIMAG